MILTPEQEKMLADLREQYAITKRRRRDRRAELVRLAHEEAEREIRDDQVRLDILAFVASEAGVPTARIAKDGFGTTAWQTAGEAIKRGEKYAPLHGLELLLDGSDVESVPESPFTRINEREFLFTLSEGEESVVTIESDGNFDVRDGDYSAPAIVAFFGEDEKHRVAARAWLKGAVTE